MSDSLTTVNFEDENGDLITMEVIAQTSKDGKEYILVADPEDDLAYILKDVLDDLGVEYYSSETGDWYYSFCTDSLEFTFDKSSDLAEDGINCDITIRENSNKK